MGSISQLDATVRAEPPRARVRLPDGPIERTTASLCLWPWVQLALRDGMRIDAFCALAGVSESALRDPAVRFSQPVCDRVAQLVVSRFGPGAPMQAARLIEPGQFQLVELIARSVSTVKDGLEHGCRFFPLLHDGGHLLYEMLAGDRVALRWEPPQSYPVHHAFVELTFAVLVVGVRREAAQPELAPEEVWFRHRAPDDRALHHGVLGVAPRFGMPEDRMLFGAEALRQPLMRANAAVHEAATAAGTAALDE
jgi:hypothetical protein